MEMVEMVFEIERETKNTVRYKEIEEDEPAKVGTLYVQKWCLKRISGNGRYPKRVRVTIEAEE